MKKLILGLSLLTLVGCGSATKKKNSDVFVKNYTGESYKKAKSVWSSCPKNLSLNKEKDWKKLLKLTNACVSGKEWSKVKQLAYRIMELEADSPWGPYYLSLSAESEGKVRKAIWMADLSLKKAPNSGMLHYHKGRLLWLEKDYELAIAEIEKALDIDKNLLEAHLFLGQVKQRDHQYGDAKDHYFEVLKRDSDNYTALLGMGNTLMNKNDHRGAAEFFEKAVSEKSNELEPRIKLAYLYEKYLSEPEKALRQYKKVNAKFKGHTVKKHFDVNLVQKINSLEKKIVEMNKAKRKISSQSQPNKKVN